MFAKSVSSDSSDEEVRCLHTQCGLCHQAFVENDDIIIGYQHPTPTTYVSYGMKLPSSRRYHPCNGCSPDEKLFRGSHLGCFNLISCEAYVALLRITKRSFEPTSPNSREQRLKNDLALRLRTTLRQPLDITIEIAQYLTQEYAVALLSSLHPVRRPGFIRLDVSAPIILQEAQYEGKSYLSFASNAEGPRSQYRPRLLFLSEDEFGITGLRVTTSESPPLVTLSPSVWWKTVILREDECMIRLYHDGLKFRFLEYRGRSTRDSTLWSVPRIPRAIRSQSWSSFTGALEPMRMLSFSYNFANMTGLSVRCGCGPAAWFAHTADDDLSCYAMSSSMNSIWIYVPLQNERITTLWQRHPSLPQDLAFAFETNKKRCFLVGAQGALRHLQSAWSILDVPASEPGTFFFDCHPGGSRRLSFVTTAPSTTRMAPPLPRPMSTLPESLTLESYHWSSASLEGITSLRQCQHMDRGVLRVIGLLFEYNNGAMATVGQVRLDSLTAPRAVDQAKPMWLAFRLTDLQLPYVSQVEFSESPIKGSGWFETDWAGVLERWFLNVQDSGLVERGRDD